MKFLSNRDFGIYIILAGVNYSICGLVCSIMENPVEQWWSRLIIVIPGILIGFYLVFFRLKERWVSHIVYTILSIGTVQYLYFSALSGFNYFYACGLFCVASACIIIINSKLFLIVYIALMNIIATVLIPSVDENQFRLLLFNLYSFSLIMLYFQNDRIDMFSRLSNALNGLKESQLEIEQIYTLNLQAAHDLASPISAIAIVADKVKEENPKAHKLLESSMNRIKDISSDLLKMHKENLNLVESNFFDIENNISQIIKEKRDEYSGINNLFIFYRLTSPVLRKVKISKSEFYRVISNLINNSVDAMEKCVEKRIKIEISPRYRDIEILISDNGCGIDQTIKHQIFQENMTTKANGTGLGLSYAKKTIEKWGGTIRLVKTSPAGSQFSIIIPFY